MLVEGRKSEWFCCGEGRLTGLLKERRANWGRRKSFESGHKAAAVVQWLCCKVLLARVLALACVSTGGCND